MLTHQNILSAAVNHVIGYQFSSADICYHVMPLYHAMEVSLVVCHFYVGGANFTPDLFSGHDFWKNVKDYGVTNITGVYTMMLDILDAFEEGNYEKGTLHTIACGGQSVLLDIIQRTNRVLGRDVFMQVYGLTEAAPLLTYMPKSELILQPEDSRRLASIGKEFFTCHVRVVNEKDQDVRPGEFGEIIGRGPNVMQGYWNRPQETEEALQGGWLRTGDLGTIDADGYIYHVDRKKDLIISGGENIAPREVEDVIYQHPKVRECSVIGVPDERWGEQVRAYVVLRSGDELSEPELLSFCEERLGKYKLPQKYCVRAGASKRSSGQNTETEASGA